MYCNQCGSEMKDGANFCKRCGAPADKAEEPVSERERRIVRFLYTYKKRILVFVLIGLVLCGAGVWAAVFFMGNSSAGNGKMCIRDSLCTGPENAEAVTAARLDFPH